ncbi:MAG: tRNA uridine-5-carboxymethylaminomethyl(34) synthesis GTPase MnmE [Opitutaceae bacterium]|nr:tRNA uridine-5-carboxymethylaminomethyl(34) synthesis GTPase MnmE [Opitutaceae bacterium]
MSLSADTIAALATPVGTSAIAVVRASGPQAAQFALAIFGEAPLPRQVRHADYRDVSGQLLDDILFTFFAAPHSYTGEDTLEISSHGNPFIAQKILKDLYTRGCRPAEAGEFTKRAFLNGHMDLSQAEAVMDLIHARSERALMAANQQLRGSLGRHVQQLIDRLLKVIAHIEAYIDFPEEDLPPQSRAALLEDIELLSSGTGRLLATSHYGELLRDGIKTVILGETNAGKSSVLNRLVGRERALVSPEPGTTRDYLEELIAAGPHCLRLIDTAGLNPNPTPLERRGLAKTFEQADKADLFLWVIDSTRPFSPLPQELATRMTAANTIAVFNKIDLAQIGQMKLPQPFVSVHASALTGAGFDALEAAILSTAEAFRVETGDEILAINARHAHALDQANHALSETQLKLMKSCDIELIASDLRYALDALGEIAGKIDNDRVLDIIFSTFCIGK